MKKPEKIDWSKIDIWRINEELIYWVLMEFKFIPNLKDEEAQKDIEKLAEISLESIKRIYFFSIDGNEEYYRYIKKHGYWFKNYYREGRARPLDEENNEWEFKLIKPEEL